MPIDRYGEESQACILSSAGLAHVSNPLPAKTPGCKGAGWPVAEAACALEFPAVRGSPPTEAVRAGDTDGAPGAARPDVAIRSASARSAPKLTVRATPTRVNATRML